jgi:glucokinase
VSVAKAAANTEITGLVGDVGGTNARFAVAQVAASGIRVHSVKVLHAADYPTAAEALSAYLAGLPAKDRPSLAVIAAAGPINRGAVEFTNNPRWRFSEAGVVKSAGFRRVRLINDFTAQALALEHLKPASVHLIGPRGKAATDGSMLVMGPGTGFGAGALIIDGDHRSTVTGEGGHTNFAPGDVVELEIVRRLAKRFDPVSIEHLLSGPGLRNLYQTLGEIGGEPAPLADPAEITKSALAGDPLSRLALDRFCAILGSVAGDFALAFGARRGVYISGGIAPGILDVLEASDFRRRFEHKDRMSDYLKPIPTRVVIEPHAALIGAASLLKGLAVEPAA